MKIKSIVKIFRHGARSSSTIGRLEDKILSPNRRGLTCVGYSQFYKIGMDLVTKIENNFDSEFYNDFDSFLRKGKMKIILSERNRVLESAQALAHGIISAHSDQHNNFEFQVEKEFAQNVYSCEKYHSLWNNNYNTLLKNFSFFHNKQEIIRRYPEGDQSKINFEINHKIFDKTLNINDDNQMDIKERILKQYESFESEREENYIKQFKPYLKKLMLYDLSGKIIDFKENREISEEYFERSDFSLNHIKKLLDFIRCNKFYEDIPVYAREYSEFIKNVKDFLITHYNNSSTYEDDMCFTRLDNFFHILMSIVEDNNTSYNIFINHNTAMRSLIKFLLSKDAYQALSNSSLDIDEDFFILCPKFAAEYKLIVREDKTIQLFIDDRNITNLLKKEFLINKNGEEFVDYYKFKSYLNSYHTIFL